MYRMMRKFLLLLLIHMSHTFSEPFLRYTTPQIIEHFNPFITHTSKKIRNNQYGTKEREFWQKSNRNIHSAIKYAKLRNDKCLYLGWATDAAAQPLMYIFLDIESTNILQITHIIQNPCIEIQVDFSLFKNNLIEFTDNIGIYLDISQLKDYDEGRWYLDFIHSRS